MILLLAIFGAIFNRVRGGWILSSNGGALNALAFGILVGGITGDWLAILAAALGMFAGQSFGWGRYIGASCGYEKMQLKEVWFIDALIAWLRPEPTGWLTRNYGDKSMWHYQYPTLRLRIWGIVGLSLRGLVWTTCLGVSIAYWAPASFWWPVVFSGLSMGLVYPIAREIAVALKTQNPNGDGWELGEFIFGAILWVSVLIQLTK